MFVFFYEFSQFECFAFIFFAHCDNMRIHLCVCSRSEGGGAEEEAAVGHRAVQISAKLA